MQINFWRSAQVWKVPSALQVGQFRVRITLVGFLSDHIRQGVLVKDIHYGYWEMGDFLWLDVTADTVHG